MQVGPANGVGCVVEIMGGGHPNLLDDVFYTAAADGRSILLASDPYDIEAIREWAASPKARMTIDNLSGAELSPSWFPKSGDGYFRRNGHVPNG
jgi:hypothetical protein